jgi:LysM repeat protein
MALNGIRSSRKLMAGKTLRIPASASTGSLSTSRPSTHKVRRGDTLSEIAAAYGVSPRDLRAWNGMSGSTVYVGQTLQLQPGSNGSAATQVAKVEHTVRPGEFPGKIAAKYGVSTAELLKWNNLKPSSTIHVNDTLVVYGIDPGEAERAATRRVAKVAPKKHKVVSGDTPSEIAEQYGVKLSQFRAWNGLNRGDAVVLGKSYYVSDPSGAAAAADSGSAAATAKYKVQPGESPWILAKKHGVRLNDLLAWNGWSKNTVLRVGDAYVVKAGAGSGSNDITHTVTSGESPWTIARKYGVSTKDLFAWNGWDEGHLLHVGEKVKILK